jgi:hypothetical protein
MGESKFAHAGIPVIPAMRGRKHKIGGLHSRLAWKKSTTLFKNNKTMKGWRNGSSG